LSALRFRASAYYRRAGLLRLAPTGGKLGRPVFRAILEQDCSRTAHGCWILARARDCWPPGCSRRGCQASAGDGRWLPHWPPPPAFKAYVGVEINAQEARQRAAPLCPDAGVALEIVHADSATSTTARPTPS
jgi:hypothetical protein